ncbi:MAG: sulfur oxidation c-type cytochrome SoxX [Candidatus Parcubacteria bacterium]|nr:sulfur oxidation c-type cytochrome SoxX [Burkholderiales bacterium]
MKLQLIALALFFPLVPSSLQAQDAGQALKRDFQARGQATMDRLGQDALQRVCTKFSDQPPAALAKLLEADQYKAIPFPAGSLIGDWKRGEAIAQSGRGASWSDARGAAGGGSCYNCHQLSPQEDSHGTLGPSLLRFGKLRGNGADSQRYAYGKIYNAKAYNLCSQMPRLGHSGTLTDQQIRDLVGLLLDPDSPVNK